MNRKGGVITGVILAISSAFFFIFLGFPLFNLQSGEQTGSPFDSSVQSPEAISTIANDIDSCVANPTSDCDQEMAQVEKFCQQNKGQEQNYPFCTDSRVSIYLEHRNMAQITVNGGGSNP
ncbi:MAG: hypothetical protein KGH88_02665 [Thaumarchaeota archaeon]|nr:hypothetical protein [Nitrososphaerota archaeon]